LGGVALGRRSWLFAGSDRGGERAAQMHTLIAPAKRPNSTTSTRKPGSPTCSLALPITRCYASTSFSPGIEGQPRIKPPRDHRPAAALGVYRPMAAPFVEHDRIGSKNTAL
jgi:hypothetical protein